ncbi:MAG: hypothetical protein ACLR3R_20080 [Clostridium paraputrificum]
MRFIFVKDFTKGNIEENVPPMLTVEVDGKDLEIMNFRNYYFCVSDNTLSGRDGQVSVETPNVYEQMNSTVFNCLVPYLVKDTSYVIRDAERVLDKFAEETKRYYGVI